MTSWSIAWQTSSLSARYSYLEEEEKRRAKEAEDELKKLQADRISRARSSNLARPGSSSNLAAQGISRTNSGSGGLNQSPRETFRSAETLAAAASKLAARDAGPAPVGAPAMLSDDDDDEASRVVRELEEENRRMRSARLDRQMSGDAGARGGGAKTDRLSLGV